MATIYRLPGDTDDFISVVEEGDEKPNVTGGFVPQIVRAGGTMGPITSSDLAGGTQYTEGDEDASIVGTVMMMEVAADIVKPVQGTVADGLLVNLGSNNDITGTVTANLSATDNQVLDDISADTGNIDTKLGTIDADTSDIHTNSDTIAAGFAAEGAALGSGVLLQGDDGTDRTNVLVDTDGHLQVDVLTGGSSGTEYTEDEATANPIVGKAIMIERDDALSEVTPVEGDNIGLRGTAEGALWTQDFNSDAILADTAAIQTATEATQAALETAGGLVVNLGANNDVTVTSGTITAELSAVDNAVLDTIDAVLDTIKVDTEAIETAVEAIQSGQLADGHNVTVDNASIAVTNAGLTELASAIDTEVQVDVVGALPAGTNSIGKVGHDITGIGHGVKTVSTAGTDEALAGSTACKRVVIQAQTDNTSGVAVGAAGVDATISTGTGVFLYPGDSIELEIDNLADVFVDSLVNGEGVRFVYFT